MLASLRIENVVLIECLSLEFADEKGMAGLCALTGETGAGKSILLDSLGLALGARSESGLVRKGAEQAQVSAEFHIGAGHPSFNILENAGLDGDGTMILRRQIGRDGRSRAFINDQPVSVALLREVGGTLVEIHGQFETQGLLNPATHLALLDEYAQAGEGAAAQWQAWRDAAAALEDLWAQAEQARAEETYLRQALEDLDALEVKPGEEAELAGLRESLMHREQVVEALNAAYHALNGENDPVRAAWAALDRAAAKAGEALSEAIAALDRAAAEIQEALTCIRSVSDDLESSEHDLETIDERLFALRAQARKFGCAVDELPEKREELARRLDLIEHADEALAAQMKAVEKARTAYVEEAKALRAARIKAGDRLDRLVRAELAPLKLDKARFVTDITELPESEWGARGIDRVRFLVATNPGGEPGPLHKIASGGEMARFMLALKVVMAGAGSAGTMIFDEVDAGIGGAVADAVGERLAGLAKDKQVLAVTHAPQVAARAARHWIVSKSGAKSVTTAITRLDTRQSRCEEIARMLSGASVTEEARAAAGKLLETGT